MQLCPLQQLVHIEPRPGRVESGHETEGDDLMLGPWLLACPVVTQGATGGVFYTIDSGTNWFRSILHVQIDATATYSLNAIWMSGLTGTVVGGNGVILRTTTGGQ